MYRLYTKRRYCLNRPSNQNFDSDSVRCLECQIFSEWTVGNGQWGHSAVQPVPQ